MCTKIAFILRIVKNSIKSRRPVEVTESTKKSETGSIKFNQSILLKSFFIALYSLPTSSYQILKVQPLAISGKTPRFGFSM